LKTFEVDIKFLGVSLIPVVWQQFGQVFRIVVVVIVNMTKSINHPVTEVNTRSFAATQQGIDDSRIFRRKCDNPLLKGCPGKQHSLVMFVHDGKQ
jgi:hypothetical protein